MKVQKEQDSMQFSSKQDKDKTYRQEHNWFQVHLYKW